MFVNTTRELLTICDCDCDVATEVAGRDDWNCCCCDNCIDWLDDDTDCCWEVCMAPPAPCNRACVAPVVAACGCDGGGGVGKGFGICWFCGICACGWDGESWKKITIQLITNEF